MRNLRKLGSLLLVLVMCLALSVPAFAATGSTSGTVTVTVTNATENVKYTVYKLAHLDGVDGDAYSYKLNSMAGKTGNDRAAVEADPWYGFFAALPNTEVTDAGYIVYKGESTGDTWKKSVDAVKISRDAKKWAEDHSISGQSFTADKDGSFEMPLSTGTGYYLVVSSLGNVAMMDTAEGNALSITEKVAVPAVTQYISSATAGDITTTSGKRLVNRTMPAKGEATVYAFVQVPMSSDAAGAPIDVNSGIAPVDEGNSPVKQDGRPGVTGTGLSYAKVDFVFTDGLDFTGVATYDEDSIGVNRDNVGVTQDGGKATFAIGVMRKNSEGDYAYGGVDRFGDPTYTVYGSGGSKYEWADQSDLFTVVGNEGGHGFSVTFSELFLNNYVNPGETIVICYYMKLNDSAKVSYPSLAKGEDGTVSQGISGTTPGFQANTSTVTLTYGENLTAAPATVELYTMAVPVYKYANDDQAAKLAGADFQLENRSTSEKFSHLDKHGGWKQSGTTGNDGYVIFRGIAGDDYSPIDYYDLTETAAPAGYNKLAEALQVKVSGIQDELDYHPENGQAPVVRVSTAAEKSVVVTVTGPNGSSGEYRAMVSNTSGAQLPETGGSGVTYILIAGFALVAVAGAGYVATRKKED